MFEERDSPTIEQILPVGVHFISARLYSDNYDSNCYLIFTVDVTQITFPGFGKYATTQGITSRS